MTIKDLCEEHKDFILGPKNKYVTIRNTLTGAIFVLFAPSRSTSDIAIQSIDDSHVPIVYSTDIKKASLNNWELDRKLIGPRELLEYQGTFIDK